MREYALIRSNRRTVSMEIHRNLAVLVRAPLHCPKGEIDRFVRRHEDWIMSHMEKQRKRVEAHPEPTEEQRKALIAKNIRTGGTLGIACCPFLGALGPLGSSNKNKRRCALSAQEAPSL